MTDFNTHPLITHSQYRDSSTSQPIIWDIREPPEYARYPSDPWHPISHFDLSQLATEPAIPILHIVCAIFPGSWPIRVSRSTGVTIGDVLGAIHSELIKRISSSEWNALSVKQQRLTTAAFYRRCELAPDRAACRSHGVIRVDCLVEHTWFSGLTVSDETDNSCIMSLRRRRHED